jgi:uncharacterized protein (TIGR02646 family)
MIHVDRSRVPKPSVLKSRRVAQESKKAWQFYSRPAPERSQERFEWTPLWREVYEDLAGLFLGKCAFCESPLVSQQVLVDHLRPKAQAVNLDGLVSADHYWWLAYEWTNLYPMCERCSQMKGSRFPVRGPRAGPEAIGEALLAEEPLLLDPCQDDPEQHLVYDQSGLVASATERGRVTIEVFGLNQEGLRQRRQKHYAAIDYYLRALDISWPPGACPPPLAPLVDPARPYAGMRRQVVAHWLQELAADIRQRFAEQQPEFTEAVAKSVEATSSKEASQETVQSYQDYKKATYSVASQEEENKKRYYESFRPIERIEICNFKGIRQLEISFRGGDSAHVPWLALIGENGAGKSSILQAVALALAGDEYRRELPVKPKDVLHFGSESGSVTVYLAGGQEPIQLRFRQGSSDFEATPSEPQVLFLGYGATRLLPRARHKPRPGKSYARTDNLFDPFVPLQNAEQWLVRLGEDSFDQVARAVKDLLSMEEKNRVVRWQDRTPPRVEALIFDEPVPISHLSDGYQSVLALATDIMAVMLDRWPAMEVAEGIVLIDEIEAHIHPRWKQRIVKSLRQTFPRIQFLFTTHEPLCLQNCSKGEVHLMSRDQESQAIKIEQVDIPPGLRADQILTGWWFGLSTSIDDGTLDLLEEHRRLLLAPGTKQSQTRLQALERDLRQRLGGFADTSVERLALSAAAEVMGQEQPPLGPAERLQIRQKILDRIKATGG